MFKELSRSLWSLVFFEIQFWESVGENEVQVVRTEDAVAEIGPYGLKD